MGNDKKELKDFSSITVNIWDDYAAQPEFNENEDTNMYVEESELSDTDRYNISKFIYGASLMLIYENQEKYGDVDCKFEEKTIMNGMDNEPYESYKIILINFSYEKLEEFFEDMKKLNLKYNGIKLDFISES